MGNLEKFVLKNKEELKCVFFGNDEEISILTEKCINLIKKDNDILNIIEIGSRIIYVLLQAIRDNILLKKNKKDIIQFDFNKSLPENFDLKLNKKNINKLFIIEESDNSLFSLKDIIIGFYKKNFNLTNDNFFDIYEVLSNYSLNSLLIVLNEMEKPIDNKNLKEISKLMFLDALDDEIEIILSIEEELGYLDNITSDNIMFSFKNEKEAEIYQKEYKETLTEKEKLELLKFQEKFIEFKSKYAKKFYEKITENNYSKTITILSEEMLEEAFVIDIDSNGFIGYQIEHKKILDNIFLEIEKSSIPSVIMIREFTPMKMKEIPFKNIYSYKFINGKFKSVSVNDLKYSYSIDSETGETIEMETHLNFNKAPLILMK